MKQATYHEAPSSEPLIVIDDKELPPIPPSTANFTYENPTGRHIADSPLLADPYESRCVFVKKSGKFSSASSLFPRQNISTPPLFPLVSSFSSFSSFSSSS
jgi:hypothetical protein